jgi:hypothetical protein
MNISQDRQIVRTSSGPAEQMGRQSQVLGIGEKESEEGGAGRAQPARLVAGDLAGHARVKSTTIALFEGGEHQAPD